MKNHRYPFTCRTGTLPILISKSCPANGAAESWLAAEKVANTTLYLYDAHVLDRTLRNQLPTNFATFLALAWKPDSGGVNCSRTSVR